MISDEIYPLKSRRLAMLSAARREFHLLLVVHPYPTWQQGQTSNIQIYGYGNTVGMTQGQGQDGGY